ncbi:MAG: hypothetical protein IT561_27675, partial [Alphaproteobacteria bacterium]|nr:hypothetical protein [Alphaproteobacteria bacterium]
MTLDHAHPPPADGPTMAVLPLALLASGIGHPIAGRALQVMRRRHRAVFARLEELGEAAFLIDPTDLPLFFVL